MIHVRKRFESFRRWQRVLTTPPDPARQSPLSPEREAAAIAYIHRLMHGILGRTDRIPKVAPADVRKTLQAAIPQRGRRLAELFDIELTDDVLLEAIDIAIRRKPFQMDVPSALAFGIVTATPWMGEFCADLPRPDSAPTMPKTRRSDRG